MSRIKLKDIAIEKNERVDNPSRSQYDTFVGLEHYDTGEAIIRRFGSTERLESSMKVFRAGDILVARRNVYLKRAATVNFNGLTSGDSIVLHIENEAYRRIIPFVLNTDDFWNYANQHADGSMSKRLSPKLLLEYEFSLPDDNLDQISDILWGMERTKNAYKDLITKTDDLVKSQFVEMFGIPETGDTEWPEYKLQKLLDIGWITYHLDGNHGSDYPRANEFVESGVPYISANCVVDGRIDFTNAKYVTEARANRFRKGIAENKDVLFAHNATVGPVAILETTEPRVILGTSLTAFRCNTEHILPEYLKAYLECPRFVRQYEAEMQQSTRKQVPITTQRKYTIIVPDIDRQKAITRFVEQSDKSKFAGANRNLSRCLGIR